MKARGCVIAVNVYLLYLQHDHTHLFDTLDDGFWGSRDCHCTFSGVRQHVPCYLNLGPCGLEHNNGLWVDRF